MGQLVAFGFIVIGIIRFFGGAGVRGFWLVFIGWFLLGAARTSYAPLAIAECAVFEHLMSMTNDCPVVSGRTNLQTLVCGKSPWVAEKTTVKSVKERIYG